ncbi:uncharacterized protein METZ01_LOCUS235350, partial [marine metagenome]
MAKRLVVKNSHRVVIKVGSSLLIEGSKGEVRRKWLESLADDIASLRAKGCEIILVSSGAIAVGRAQLEMRRRVLKLEEKQAAAAVGQIQ